MDDEIPCLRLRMGDFYGNLSGFIGAAAGG